ncbi:hypothetical protein PTTG_00111 [Puccinia triticina 1-1 BBBD Race 1]|uniref:Palmitoyltransferase n=2 Tax=Puccinia triticina TaxID=208348 RepID=A0A180GW19_PUCT1|nr:hypothetical protein PTTG_00111 [Puccinia triticina 1-1 BBBD Race 1]
MASRILKEVPLLLVLVILLWAQYSVSLSLVLNYLLLTAHLAPLALAIGIPFNLFWASTIINLLRCIATGPGWLDRATPPRNPPDLERPPHKTLLHPRPHPGLAAPYDPQGGEDSDPDDEPELEHSSSVPLLAPSHPSSSSHRPIPASNGHRPRLPALVPRPPLTSTDPPSYLADHRHLPPSNLSFQEQVQRQQRSSAAQTDLLLALNFPPPPTPAPRTELSRPPESLMCKSDGSLRFCRKCEHYKADRSHHCSSCGRCVLRMDHHCPWLGGRCVGLNNHKFFILFLLSASITSIIAASAAAKGLIHFVSNTRISPTDPFQLAPLNWAFLTLVGGLFGMVLAGFTSYHLYLISVNRTTIENMERSVRIRPTGTRDPSESYALLRTTRLRAFDASQSGTAGLRTEEPGAPAAVDGAGEGTEGARQQPAKLPSYNLPIYKSDDQLSRLERRKLEAGATKLNLFDLGSTRENFRQVFGVHSPLWHWPLPLHPIGISDGYHYPINHHNLHQLIQLTSEIRLLPNERSNELRFERP